MKIILTVLLLIVAVPYIAFSQPANDGKVIDKIFMRSVDVTGDGIPDNITLMLRAKSINDPVFWDLTIKTPDGKQIYNYSSNDSGIDKFFGDEGYVQGCNGYLECKQKYYFKDLGSLNIIVPRSEYDLEGILQEGAMIRDYLLTNYSIHGTKADNIVSTLHGRIRRGDGVLISITASPVIGGPLMMYSPEIGAFVLIYQE